jgi:eukaryotic-like serine/threonine-protein kinase
VTEPAAGVTLAGGRYRLVEPLGGGGMATVWMAQDTRLGREVAVKVISDALAVQAPYVERFRREARIAAGLSHPNLVKVYDFGSEAERPFLVMEYIDGAALSRGSAADVAAQVDSDTLARELLDALRHIHEAGIVHRDIKPANVLVGPDGRPRLTDFGIARADDSTELTETGQVIGTLKYLAPEVARGQPASARSDLYSLGVLLSEVVGGDASPSLARLIGRLTETDPSDRPASAAQALSALDRASDVTAVTRPLVANGVATARHRSALLAVGVAAALAAVAVLIVIATAGGGGKSSASTVRTAPANAPLSQQLDTLDRMVNGVSGH